MVDEIGVPSVTTILSATKDKKFLDDWRRRIGNEEADKIMKQASTRGSEMHRVLEYYYNGEKYFNEMEDGIKPRKMASVIIDNLKVILQMIIKLLK